MENPYKPGDIVVFYGPPERRADPSKRLRDFGKKMIVTDVERMGAEATLVTGCVGKQTFIAHQRYFAPEKFKPGDRVRIVALPGNTSPLLLGAEATVSAVSITHSLISLIVPARNLGSYVAYPWGLELIERAPANPATPAPKFMVGDRVRYVVQHGVVPYGSMGVVKAKDVSDPRRVGPWAVEFEHAFEWGHDCASPIGSPHTKEGHGRWCADDSLELAEREWKPTAEAVAKQTKRLLLPTPNRDPTQYWRNGAAEPSPAYARVSYVVSVVGADSMTFDFAANPKRHDRRAHAETEAARLSKLHPGETFRVFRLEPLTDTTTEAPKPAATKVVRFEDNA